jgi:hypothetical protein
MATAGDLLKRYGPAYLLTSISFATVSYAACYMAVARGINVPALLTRFGMQATAANEKVGTASIAVRHGDPTWTAALGTPHAL